jgi:hypothetical protein
MTTYTTQPDGTDGIDTMLNEQLPTTNHGTETVTSVGYNTSSSNKRRGLLKFDLSKGTNPPPSTATASSAVITLNCSTYNVTRTLATYQVLRDWVEAQVTWNIWKTSNNWTTAGCGSAGNDYVNTDLGSVSVTGTGTVTLTLNAAGLAIVQGWIDGSIANYGLLLKHTAETTERNVYDSSDNATAGNRPQLVIEYTTPAAGTFVAKFVSF